MSPGEDPGTDGGAEPGWTGADPGVDQRKIQGMIQQIRGGSRSRSRVGLGADAEGFEMRVKPRVRTQVVHLWTDQGGFEAPLQARSRSRSKCRSRRGFRGSLIWGLIQAFPFAPGLETDPKCEVGPFDCS